MNEKFLAIMVVYQIGLLLTFIGIMIAVPSDKLSESAGLRGHLAYMFRLVFWPYGLYYYMLRDNTQHSQNSSQSSTQPRE